MKAVTKKEWKRKKGTLSTIFHWQKARNNARRQRLETPIKSNIVSIGFCLVVFTRFPVNRDCLLKLYIRCLQTFLSNGQISYYTTVRGPATYVMWLFRDMLHLPNQEILRKYISFSLLTKSLRRQDEMASRAVVWTHLT